MPMRHLTIEKGIGIEFAKAAGTVSLAAHPDYACKCRFSDKSRHALFTRDGKGRAVAPGDDPFERLCAAPLQEIPVLFIVEGRVYAREEGGFAGCCKAQCCTACYRTTPQQKCPARHNVLFHFFTSPLEIVPCFHCFQIPRPNQRSAYRKIGACQCRPAQCQKR